jgi:hypothetical protein
MNAEIEATGRTEAGRIHPVLGPLLLGSIDQITTNNVVYDFLNARPGDFFTKDPLASPQYHHPVGHRKNILHSMADENYRQPPVL